MSRPAVIAASILLTLSAVFAQAVLFAGPALACSCIGPPPPLAEIAAADDVAIIAGTVGPALADRTPVAVDAWFHGAAPAELVWLSGGTRQMTSCDIFMRPGERRLFVLYGSVEGLYSANSCSPSGVIGTADGDALMAEAVQAFGAPQLPPTAEPEPEPPAVPQNQPAPGDGQGDGQGDGGLSSGLLWIGAGVGLAALLFGAVAVVARVRRAD